MIDIREMNIDDVDKVYEIEISCFNTPWSKEALKKELTTNKLAYYFVAVINNEVVGYCGLWHVITEGHITNIAVDENKRMLGIGNKLMCELVNFANKKQMIGLTLELKMSNQKAFNLYKKHGFIVEGIRKNYYSDTKEDALVMWKYI